MSDIVDLSVIIPASHESSDLSTLLPLLRAELDSLRIRYEILIVTDRRPCQGLVDAAMQAAAKVIAQREPGYGQALLTGVSEAQGDFLLTMDDDLSHPPDAVGDLWQRRYTAEVVVASRYVPGGDARAPLARQIASRFVNALFRRGLRIPVHDLTSRFRLYRAPVLREQRLGGRQFDAVQRILVQAIADGWKVHEVPFRHVSRRPRKQDAGFWRFGPANGRTFWSLWKMRNSISSADYDARAYDSLIPLQRYWQRRRFRHVTELIDGEGPVLDVGCGSSRIIGALPAGSIGVDILTRKLRYARRYGVPLVRASGHSLPFRDASFPCVLCSEVIEHLPKDSPIIDELCRVLGPGGRLVLGTPDYSRWEWVALETLYERVVPGGYADEHISHYSRDELIRILGERGLTPEATHYLLRAGLIMAFRKGQHRPAVP